MNESAKDVIPDFKWYANESHRLGVPPRCPFQSVHACPRYYQSLSLLGQAGCTAIPTKVDNELLERWKRHPLWPVVSEQEPGIARGAEKTHTYSNFCPEVLFDRFGYFATFLAMYHDETDSDFAFKRLERENAPITDPRWAWSSCTPQHYTECSLYSCLSHEWVKQLNTFANILPPSTRYDVFISHASEDKDAFVRDLAIELTRLGLRVWYDEWTLKVGDNLRQRIDEGLRSASFGVVVLSGNFFQKNWPQAELDGLFAIEMSGRPCILPVLHQLTHVELLAHSPLLARKVSTHSEKGVPTVAKEIYEVVRGPAQLSVQAPALDESQARTQAS